MSLEYHWIGATGNSSSKYDWNVGRNWIVYDKSWTNFPQANPYYRANQSPKQGDTVIIGQKFHCFSPLLFGGYSGGVSDTDGSWGSSGGASAGATDGGINLRIITDTEASSNNASISASLVYGTGTAVTNKNVSLMFEGIDDRNFIQLLQQINPHSSVFSHTGAANYDYDSSLYPFPYLGGGLTGEILEWALRQHELSFSAGLSANIERTAMGLSQNNVNPMTNAWVGGGFTGVYSEPRTSSLKIRHSNLTIASGRQLNDDPFNNTRIFDLSLVQNRHSSGVNINSSINVNQYKNPSHYYTFRNGIVKDFKIAGDATVEVINMTASYIESDLHSTLKMDHTSVVGGMQIVSGQSTPRYNIWPLYFSGSVTAGASTAVWGSATRQNAPELPYTNKIVIRQPLTKDIVGSSIGMTSSGSPSPNILLPETTDIDTYIGLGRYQGGTASYASIPYLSVESKDPGEFTTAEHSLQFIGSVKIGEINMIGGSFVPSVLLTQGRSPNDTEIFIGSLNISNGAKVFMNVNSDFDNLFFGSITGNNANNYRLIGGINALDSTCTIKPDSGVRFINTKIINDTVDNRPTIISKQQVIQLRADQDALNRDLDIPLA